MATNFNAKQAIDSAKRFVHRMPVDDSDIGLRIMNNAAQRIWAAADWRWDLGNIADKTIINDTDDYAFTETDVLYLVKAGILSPTGQVEGLTVVANLTANDNVKGSPNRIAVSGTDLRIKPVPTGIASGSEGTIVTTYKKNYTQITGDGSTASQLSFPDDWFFVYDEFVKFYAYDFTRDPRTGSCRVDSQGRFSYSDQLGIAHHALIQMILSEKPLDNHMGVKISGAYPQV